MWWFVVDTSKGENGTGSMNKYCFPEHNRNLRLDKGEKKSQKK